MTAVAPPPPLRALTVQLGTRRRDRAPLVTEGRVTFLLCAFVYGVLGCIASSRNLHFGDAETRLNQAESVAYAVDPHLAAVGFVFGPLPSLLLVPFLPLQNLFPVLEHDNIFGAVETALMMAGAATVLLATGRDLGVRRWVRIALVTCFAIHPLIVVFGANGMAEAPMLLFLAVATRRLVRWLSPGLPGNPVDLTICGLSLGAAYLCRFEPLVAGIAVIGLVASMTWLRNSGVPRRERRQRAAQIAAFVGGPFVGIVVVLAIASKLLVGQWLADAGNNQGQVDSARSRLNEVYGKTFDSRGHYLLAQFDHTEPLFLAGLVLVCLIVWRRHDARLLAVLAVQATVLLADVAVFFKGGNFGFLRYYITIVPLSVTLGLFLAAPPVQERRERRLLLAPKPPRAPALLSLTLVVAGLAASKPIFTDRNLAQQESRWYVGLSNPHKSSGIDNGDVYIMTNEQRAARAIDALGAPDGSVLTDSATTFAVQTMTKRRSVFMSSSDQRWERSVAAPSAFGIRYLFLSVGNEGLDAIGRTYPALERSGAGVATLIGDFPNKRGYGYRLYRLDPNVTGAGAVAAAP